VASTVRGRFAPASSVPIGIGQDHALSPIGRPHHVHLIAVGYGDLRRRRAAHQVEWVDAVAGVGCPPDVGLAT